MSLSEQLAVNLPFLRRYARALTGSQLSGDNFVRATLEAALADDELKASLAGGRGTVIGTLIGALIIGVINNGMNLLQVNTYAQKVILGLVILGAVMLDKLKGQTD